MKYWKLYLCTYYKIFLRYYKNEWVCAIKKGKRNKFCISGTVIQQVFIGCVAEDAKREPDSQGSIFTCGSVLQRILLLVKTKYLWLRSHHTGPRGGKSLPVYELWDMFSQRQSRCPWGRSACQVLSFSANELNKSKSFLTTPRPFSARLFLTSSEALVPSGHRRWQRPITPVPSGSPCCRPGPARLDGGISPSAGLVSRVLILGDPPVSTSWGFS